MLSRGLGYILVLVILLGCSQSNEQTNTEPITPQNPLIGKWKLVKRKFDPDKVFIENPDSIEYIKVITEKSFIWYTYNKNTKIVSAMAGGSYDLEGESYTEHIEFLHPPGSGIQGSAIPFKCVVNGNEWHHSGYINEREYDNEIGDYVVVAERRLEEFWTRLE